MPPPNVQPRRELPLAFPVVQAGITAVGAIREGWIPPTANLENPDPECDLDYTPLVKRQVAVETAMINGFGFGGQNSVVVLRRYEE